jgi:ribosomal protein S18 acetylase RimI-like enzyme
VRESNRERHCVLERFRRRGTLKIRELLDDDVDELVALFEAVLPGFTASLPAGRSEPELFLQEPTTFALGAFVDEIPVGLAWGMQMRAPRGQLTTYLHQLDVREEWRRQGIATELITEAIAVARRAGSTKFWLSTGSHNDGAQALYDSLGGDRKPLGDVNYWWTLD